MPVQKIEARNKMKLMFWTNHQRMHIASTQTKDAWWWAKQQLQQRRQILRQLRLRTKRQHKLVQLVISMLE